MHGAFLRTLELRRAALVVSLYNAQVEAGESTAVDEIFT